MKDDYGAFAYILDDFTINSYDDNNIDYAELIDKINNISVKSSNLLDECRNFISIYADVENFYKNHRNPDHELISYDELKKAIIKWSMFNTHIKKFIYFLEYREKDVTDPEGNAVDVLSMIDSQINEIAELVKDYHRDDISKEFRTDIISTCITISKYYEKLERYDRDKNAALKMIRNFDTNYSILNDKLYYYHEFKKEI